MLVELLLSVLRFVGLGEKPFACRCGKNFTRLDNLRQHASTIHADEPEANEELFARLAANMPRSGARAARRAAAPVRRPRSPARISPPSVLQELPPPQMSGFAGQVPRVAHAVYPPPPSSYYPHMPPAPEHHAQQYYSVAQPYTQPAHPTSQLLPTPDHLRYQPPTTSATHPFRSSQPDPAYPASYPSDYPRQTLHPSPARSGGGSSFRGTWSPTSAARVQPSRSSSKSSTSSSRQRSPGPVLPC